MTPEETLQKMRIISANFYHGAQLAKCHNFLEFTGLINEYIEICEQNLTIGIDFTQANAHTGQHLKIMPYQVDYLNEKLECIFQGLIVLGQETDK